MEFSKSSRCDLRGTTIADELGLEVNARFLIVHADDLAMAHSVNQATFRALENRTVSSASIMAPCPWFMEVAQYARQHTTMDLGIHLTLTSEWEGYRWGPVAPRSCVMSLVDETGYFHRDFKTFLRNAEREEVAAEIRAQIERVLACGIRPSHLDSHMGVLFGTPELHALMVSVGEEYGLPCLGIYGRGPENRANIGFDSVSVADERIASDDWEIFYAGVLTSLTPGLHELVVHLGTDDNELRAITSGSQFWNAAWRQRDFDFIQSSRFKSLLEAEDIEVVDWSVVKSRLLCSSTGQLIFHSNTSNFSI